MKRAVMVVAIIAVALAGVGAWWWGWGRSPQAEDVQAVASEFSAPSDWQQIESTIRGRAPFCGDVTCPRATRRWRALEVPTADVLRTSMLQSGWRDVYINGDCQPKPDRVGSFPLCLGSARTDDMVIELTVTGPRSDAEAPFAVTLVVEG